MSTREFFGGAGPVAPDNLSRCPALAGITEKLLSERTPASMTKTDYRKYIQSESWQQRRKQYLLEYSECNRCSLPRYLAVIAYDQDLNVHHRNYQNLGDEKNSDLEALCRRCHEIESFGNSGLREIRPVQCVVCFEYSQWDPWAEACDACLLISASRKRLQLAMVGS